MLLVLACKPRTGCATVAVRREHPLLPIVLYPFRTPPA